MYAQRCSRLLTQWDAHCTSMGPLALVASLTAPPPAAHRHAFNLFLENARFGNAATPAPRFCTSASTPPPLIPGEVTDLHNKEMWGPFVNREQNVATAAAVPAARRRLLKTLFNSALFFGKSNDDTAHGQAAGAISRAREEVASILRDACTAQPKPGLTDSHRAAFWRVFCEVVRALEDPRLGDRVPVALSTDLMWIGEGAPNHALLKEVLDKCLRTAWCAACERQENHSGFAIAGPNGVGKSTLARTVALVVGTIVPNFQTVFVALGSVKLPDRASVIDKALRAAGAHVGLGIGADESLTELYSEFGLSGCALGLVVDDAPSCTRHTRQRRGRTCTALPAPLSQRSGSSRGGRRSCQPWCGRTDSGCPVL